MAVSIRRQIAALHENTSLGSLKVEGVVKEGGQGRWGQETSAEAEDVQLHSAAVLLTRNPGFQWEAVTSWRAAWGWLTAAQQHGGCSLPRQVWSLLGASEVHDDVLTQATRILGSEPEKGFANSPDLIPPEAAGD